MTIYYDGASLGRTEAIARVEQDARAFLTRTADDFAGDQSEWYVLLEDLDLAGSPLDELPQEVLDGPPTISWGPSVSFGADGVMVVALTDRLPKRLAAIHAALSAQPWCAQAHLETGSLPSSGRRWHEEKQGRITVRLRRLDLPLESRIASVIQAGAQECRSRMRSGVASLAIVIRPDDSGVRRELEASLHGVDAIEAAKLDVLRRLS